MAPLFVALDAFIVLRSIVAENADLLPHFVQS
jgi:hypothetical protein